MFLFCLFLLAIIMPSPGNAHPPTGAGPSEINQRSDEELISDVKEFMPKVMKALIKCEMFDFIKYTEYPAKIGRLWGILLSLGFFHYTNGANMLAVGSKGSRIFVTV